MVTTAFNGNTGQRSDTAPPHTKGAKTLLSFLVFWGDKKVEKEEKDSIKTLKR